MTEQQLKNGISLQDINSIDSIEFFEFLESQVDSDSNSSRTDMSAQEFYNNF